MLGWLAWAATICGWLGTWRLPRRDGWILTVGSAAAWTAVDWRLGVTAGVVASTITAAIAARNWRRERRCRQQRGSTTP